MTMRREDEDLGMCGLPSLRGSWYDQWAHVTYTRDSGAALVHVLGRVDIQHVLIISNTTFLFINNLPNLTELQNKLFSTRDVTLIPIRTQHHRPRNSRHHQVSSGTDCMIRVSMCQFGLGFSYVQRRKSNIHKVFHLVRRVRILAI